MQAALRHGAGHRKHRHQTHGREGAQAAIEGGDFMLGNHHGQTEGG